MPYSITDSARFKANPTLMAKHLQQVFSITPRLEQLEAIKTLAVDQQDLILIAKTGFGKSLVFNSVPFLRGGVALIIMPLNAIEEGQTTALLGVADRARCSPIVLNGDSNTPELRVDIQRGYYSHVFLSPEIAISEPFTTVLQDQSFQKRLVLVAIDELHVIAEWGTSWRPAYSKLAVLRNRINSDVPWFGTSATLDLEMLTIVKELAGFGSSTVIQKTSVNRPEIYLDVRPMAHSYLSFKDLEFLIEAARKPSLQAADIIRGGLADHLGSNSQLLNAVKTGDMALVRRILGREDPASIIACQKADRLQRLANIQQKNDTLRLIPKTIVYFESIANLEAARERLVAWLQQLGYSETAARTTIRPYYSEMAEYDKRQISFEFSKPGLESSIRIVLATDAMGMGVDNPDIAQVIQYGLTKSMCSLNQRAGRAARRNGATGTFIWLVEPWAFGPKIEQYRQSVLQSQSQSQSQPRLASLSQVRGLDNEELDPKSDSECPPIQRSRGKVAEEEAERRSKLPPGFWPLLNKTSCIRQTNLEFFAEEFTPNCGPDKMKCCCRCAGTVIKPARIHHVQYTQSSARITKAVAEALTNWRTEQAPTWNDGYIFTDPQIILPNSVIRTISRAAGSIDDLTSLEDCVRARWAGFELFGSKVLRILLNARLTVQEKDKFPVRTRSKFSCGTIQSEAFRHLQHCRKLPATAQVRQLHSAVEIWCRGGAKVNPDH